MFIYIKEVNKLNYIFVPCIFICMKQVETLLDEEVLTVSRLKEILEELPEDMVVADIYHGQLLEVTRVAIYQEHEDGEDTLVIG